jgi:hypothetical protein
MSPRKTHLHALPKKGNGFIHQESALISRQGSTPVVQADTGMGTTYERWALNRLLVRLHHQLGFRNALEAPEDGMTGISGINSLILGLRKVEITLLLSDPDRAGFARKVWGHHAPGSGVKILNGWDENRLPFVNGQFEFVWNFNVMTRLADPLSLLNEMCRVSSRYIFICVPNRYNYAFWLHRLHHRVAKEPWDHGRVDRMEPAPWQKIFSDLGLQIQDIHWLDCPWWPDIVNPSQLIKDFFPFLKNLAARTRPESRYCWFYNELPYYQPVLHPEVHQRMARLAFFENTPVVPLKRLFAHHVAILARKG